MPMLVKGGKSGTNFSGGRSDIFSSPTLGLFRLHTTHWVITLHAAELALMIQNLLRSSERMWFLPTCPNILCMCLRMSVDTWECLGSIAGNSLGKATLDRCLPILRTPCFNTGLSRYRVHDLRSLLNNGLLEHTELWTVQPSLNLKHLPSVRPANLAKFHLLLESFSMFRVTRLALIFELNYFLLSTKHFF